VVYGLSAKMPFKFEELKIWQRALEYSFRIHQLAQGFPREELFVLTSQIKRAADSIALNIAEGSTRQSNPEFSKFLGYALRSGIEVIACLHIAKRRNLIPDDLFKSLYDELEVLIRMIQSLRNNLK
jgi:four helix bundle protein